MRRQGTCCATNSLDTSASGGKPTKAEPWCLIRCSRRERRLPAPGEPPLVQSRQYSPVHNIGHFRYLECSQLADGGRPAGNITVWDDIRFPFDPALRNEADLNGVPVTHFEHGAPQSAEESYSCDAGGTVKVTITNLLEGFSRSYRLGRWASGKKRIVLGRKKNSASK